MNNKPLRIAVLSGKGGTGKTLVSVNLAAAAKRAAYIDCDVEEPNGHLFFKPAGETETFVTVDIPVINKDLCTGCRKCVDFCNFNALALIRDRPFVFEGICHSCGGCALVCPEKAISEKKKAVGRVQKGVAGSVSVSTGILNAGEASGIPLIKELLDGVDTNQMPLTVIDCPPGSACIVMESIRDADYCILVAEPTLFGVHNLSMVYELVRLFNKPHGALINKCLAGENPAERFCIEKNIPIIGRIPFDRALGTLNSNGEIAVLKSGKYRDLFSSLLRTVGKEAANETAFDPQR